MKIETCYHDVVNSPHWHLTLARLRREKGLTQARLGCLTGLSASAVGMYEQGRRLPTGPTLQALSRALGVELGDFLARGDPFAPKALEPLLKSLAAGQTR